MGLVVDASVTMAWCFEDEATGWSEAVLDRVAQEGAAAPAVWPLEVANVLLSSERRGLISRAWSAHFVRILSGLPIAVEAAAPRPEDLLAVGRAHDLSSYDASYLLLAQREGIPLATLDAALGTAARAAGVELFADRS